MYSDSFGHPFINGCYKKWECGTSKTLEIIVLLVVARNQMICLVIEKCGYICYMLIHLLYVDTYVIYFDLGLSALGIRTICMTKRKRVRSNPVL